MMKLPGLSLAFFLLQLSCGGLRADSSKGQTVFQPKIVAVEPAAIEVQTGRNEGMKIDGKAGVNMRTYQVTDFTDIEVNGIKGTLADLSVGMTVRVTMGLDKDVADSIIATGEAPAPASPTPAPLRKGYPKPAASVAATTKKAFSRIARDVIVSVSSDRITIAPPGKRAIAYAIDPITEVRLNGVKADINQLSAGMIVTVTASGESTAGTIDAIDPNATNPGN